MGKNLQIPVQGKIASEEKQDVLNNLVTNLNNKTPSLGGAITTASVPVTLSTDGQFVDSIGNPTDSTATSNSGNFSLISLFKRALDLLTNISTGVGSGSQQRDALYQLVNSTGTIPAGATQISITNGGAQSGTINGNIFPSGVSVNWATSNGDTLGSINYDATNTVFLVLRVL
jgi:hypothetical protein